MTSAETPQTGQDQQQSQSSQSHIENRGPRFSRRRFGQATGVFLGLQVADAVAQKFGIGKNAKAAPANQEITNPLDSADLQTPADIPTTRGEVSSPYESPMRADIRKSIDAAKADQSAVFTAEDGTEISRKELLKHVTHDREIGLIIAYFVDTFMVSDKVTPTNDAQANLYQKIAIYNQQFPNWNTDFTTKMALIVDRVFKKWDTEAQISLQEGAAYTDHDYAQDESQLRRLIMYLVDVKTGNQPDLEEKHEAILKVLAYILIDVNPDLIKAYLREDVGENKENPRPRVSQGSQTPFLDVDGLISFINSNLFKEYKIEDYQDAQAEKDRRLSRRAFMTPFLRNPPERRSNKIAFREAVTHDLENMN